MKPSVYLFAILLIISSCTQQSSKNKDSQTTHEMKQLSTPTFSSDLEVLNQHHKMILLKSSDGEALVAISPDWQGRVMTSSFSGMEGMSMGWINHELIKSKEIKPHMNAFGGEDRFWLGPEGGQFTIFFKPGTEFEFANWQVPAVIDTEPFEVTGTSDSSAGFRKQMKLLNYSGHSLDLLVEREVSLLDAQGVKDILGMAPDALNFVAYESANKITNTGKDKWTRENGALSMWILGMFQPSPSTTIIIPFKEGDEETLGPKVNDTYFGKIPPDRLIVKDNVLFYKGDGQQRGKLGIGPKRALPVMGAYNSETNVLTLVSYSLPENVMDYVNSMWELQDDPFSGDVVNSYNDGPVEDGSQMGPFYELESSSPAAFLAPGEAMKHVHRTIHLTGDYKKLDEISKMVFGVSLDEVKGIFN